MAAIDARIMGDLMSTLAVGASAGGAALAFAVVLTGGCIHDEGVVALLSLKNDQGVSLLHALGGVRAVAVAALSRHGAERLELSN